ncbi:MAG: biotin synthase BioB [Nitrospirae bacterium]|nr:biotin synthase BioB [Nitrospirota bacterium]
MELLPAANRIRRHFRGNRVDLCAIVNAKSGKCSEDCAYCAQSAKSTAEITSYALLGKKTVLQKAEDAGNNGAKRFCIVTSGRRISEKELPRIADMVSSVRSLGLLPCATLGLLSEQDLKLLKNAGLERYHNNLETSERFFPAICTTHSYREKVRTIRAAVSAGLSVCSGGIFGLGETWQDRIDMAFALADLGPDSIPVNFLSPVTGTKLGRNKPLPPLEALKIISIYRFILPDRQIRVCGGRLQTLGEMNAFIFLAGADGLLVGNYLTTLGRGYAEDLDLIRNLGLIPS